MGLRIPQIRDGFKSTGLPIPVGWVFRFWDENFNRKIKPIQPNRSIFYTTSVGLSKLNQFGLILYFGQIFKIGSVSVYEEKKETEMNRTELESKPFLTFFDPNRPFNGSSCVPPHMKELNPNLELDPISFLELNEKTTTIF